jgi:hypothetical protein
VIVLGYVCPTDLSQIKSAETKVKYVLNRSTCTVVNNNSKCYCTEHSGNVSHENYKCQSRIHPYNENLKRKLYNCNPKIYFNHDCLKNPLIPNYAMKRT